jgi:putative transposase
LNRASRRAELFAQTEDYRRFLHVLDQARHRFDMRILAYAVMPNHWHLILWPDADLQLSRFMHWLTLTHTQRWHVSHGTTGTGPLYQGRYKAIPIQADDHLLGVIKYVERNPVRSGLVEYAQDWPWSSAWERCNNCESHLLNGWPIPIPADWLSIVNNDENRVQLSGVRATVRLDLPLGDPVWRRTAATAFQLKRTYCPQGRPRKK